jgi:glucose/arabinose dehydrogenase
VSRPARCGFLAFILILLAFPARAQTPPDYSFRKITGGLPIPTAIVQPPDDSSRLFISTLDGKVYIVRDGVLMAAPFLDISKEITTDGFGQGLHNIVFDPAYASNGFFYIAYTQSDRNAALVRYHVSSDNPDLADPASAKVILIIPHLTQFHYGGQLAFGPDGYLYWSMGDGAYKKSPGQNRKVLLGKILRLDVEHGDPYQVPSDNPFATEGNNIQPEIWAYGLRNPWRFSFDRQTGDLYIADVGESNREEIDFQPAHDPGGENYGWGMFEGDQPFKGGGKQGLTFPVVEYPHDGGNCSVTGGYVYRGAALPELVGKYLFGDFCSGRIWTTYRQANGIWYTAELLKTDFRITTFGEDNSGELYLGDAASKAIYRLVKSVQN